MRLCRFAVADDVRVGFYLDDRVVPLEVASHAYLDATHCEIPALASTELLAYLPPDGPLAHALAPLHRWFEGLEPSARARLALPLADVQLLVPIPRPPKILLLAGNYAAHVIERGGTVA